MPIDRTTAPGRGGVGDSQLVSAARAGDHDALNTLLRRHYDRIHALCRRLTGNDHDGADACQEALLAIVRGLPRFDARAAFSTWAYRVTTNACLDELRRRGRRPEPGLADDETGQAGGGWRPVGGGFGGAGGGAVAEGVAARLDVDAALAQLPPDFRAAVVLRDLCQLSYDEIATVLDVPPGTVRSRIARGRAALVPFLASDPDSGSPAGRRPPAGPDAASAAGNLHPTAERPTTESP